MDWLALVSRGLGDNDRVGTEEARIEGADPGLGTAESVTGEL